MPERELPTGPSPEPLRGLDSNSFAYYSIDVRLPDIARRTMAENEGYLPFTTIQNLEALIADIPDGKIRRLIDREAPDSADWDGYLAPYLGQGWLEPPWFLVENYFYRRFLEATGYFDPGEGRGYDPFLVQKRMGLEAAQEQAAALADNTNRLLARHPRRLNVDLAWLVETSLWGNQLDLSLWPAGDDNSPGHHDLDKARDYLLVDDSQAVAQHLGDHAGGDLRVDLIVDNAGFELVCDLGLADYLLAAGLSGKVVLHCKPHPTFVSDAMVHDVRETIAWLAGLSSRDARQMAQRLQESLETGQLRLAEDFFWTSPLPTWDMPLRLRQEFSSSGLVAAKGDANYRRALGDRHWSFTAPFEGIMRYFPAPYLALRTLKSEVVVGLNKEQIERQEERDPDWLTSGRWGLIQFKK
jgi:hypothetical protein